VHANHSREHVRTYVPTYVFVRRAASHGLHVAPLRFVFRVLFSWALVRTCVVAASVWIAASRASYHMQYEFRGIVVSR
jgi:hypothetical protein